MVFSEFAQIKFEIDMRKYFEYSKIWEKLSTVSCDFYTNDDTD